MSSPAQTAVPSIASARLEVGDWQIDILNGGHFLMDGGVLFGVVPKRLWQMSRNPDELNRLPVGCNCILARDGAHTVLIDAGYGGKTPALDRKFYGCELGDPIEASLQAVGVAPEQIDTVVMSHLHWDHAGGLTRRDARGGLTVSFPNARHVIGRWEWEDAHDNGAEFGGAYSADNIAPLCDRVRVDLIDHNEVVLPGLTAWVTGGHTRGHLALVLQSRGETLLAIGDLCPSTHHLRRLWALAYDLYPLQTRREKPRLLGLAADGNWIVVWTHDPRVLASRLARDPNREFVVTESWVEGG
jgi:glyoxylase-like metal-dependent hydrolase (beta-lactamase superfamily II)